MGDFDIFRLEMISDVLFLLSCCIALLNNKIVLLNNIYYVSMGLFVFKYIYYIMLHAVLNGI